MIRTQIRRYLKIALSLSGLWLLDCLGAQSQSAWDRRTTAEIAQVQRDNLQTIANDFAQLEHYRLQNAALQTPGRGLHRVVFFGDSLTEAWGLKSNGSVFFPGKPYLNRGISGQTTVQMLARFQQDVVALRPEVVLILAGTNDFAGNTGPASPAMVAANLRSMTDIAQANHIRVVLCSIMPVDQYRWRSDAKPAEAIRTLNAWLKTYATQQRLVYVDYYALLSSPEGGMKPGVSHDGVHLNAAGYALIAPLAEAGIATALAGQP